MAGMASQLGISAGMRLLCVTSYRSAGVPGWRREMLYDIRVNPLPTTPNRLMLRTVYYSMLANWRFAVPGSSPSLKPQGTPQLATHLFLLPLHPIDLFLLNLVVLLQLPRAPAVTTTRTQDMTHSDESKPSGDPKEHGLGHDAASASKSGKPASREELEREGLRILLREQAKVWFLVVGVLFRHPAVIVFADVLFC